MNATHDPAKMPTARASLPPTFGQDGSPPRIDLNCDMGESFGAWKLGNDEAILGHVTSANIACGFHAGDPRTMQRTVAAAFERGVRVGAHPGLQDLTGFGRARSRSRRPKPMRSSSIRSARSPASPACSAGGSTM